MLGAGSIYVIPYFQREYKWKAAKLVEFIDDVFRVASGESESHFIGATIIAQQPSKPSDPNSYEVVDGQQRITTVFILVCAATSILAQSGESDEARKLFNKYILHPEKYSGKSNIKLQSSQQDRRSMNKMVQAVRGEIIKHYDGSEEVRELHELSTSAASNNERIFTNYKHAIKNISERAGDASALGLFDFLSALLKGLPIVQIDVIDPTSGPNIYDRLNSKQEPMTIGDLVKNAIFQRAASKSPSEVEKLHEESWLPFYQAFTDPAGKNLFDQYFFPYGLVTDPGIKKSEVFNKLQRTWSSDQSPESVVEHLKKYQSAFMHIVSGQECASLEKGFSSAVRRCSRYGAPSSALPFLMQVHNAVFEGDLTADVGRRLFELTEAFLVRRAVCGVEPTGLHAVFKDLWIKVKDSPNPSSVAKIIQESSTVFWPKDNVFSESILSRPIYGSRVTPFILIEYNASLGGDIPAEKIEIEHILPQKPKSGDYTEFSVEQRADLLHTLANLLPLSTSMNPELGNKDFAKKREVYQRDSMFKSVRDFGKRYKVWTPKTMKARAEELKAWALSRWPLPD
jgi:hypothetical protein